MQGFTGGHNGTTLAAENWKSEHRLWGAREQRGDPSGGHCSSNGHDGTRGYCGCLEGRVNQISY